MAEVEKPVSQEIDRLIEQVTTHWQYVPETAAEIDDWDISAQLSYTEEWALVRMKQHDLEKHVAAGELTDEQMVRYQQLKGLIARNAPILQQVLEGGRAQDQIRHAS